MGCFKTCITIDPTFVLLSCGKMLLSAGADVDITDSIGRTALMLAAIGGHSRVIEVRSLI